MSGQSVGIIRRRLTTAEATRLRNACGFRRVRIVGAGRPQRRRRRGAGHAEAEAYRDRRKNELAGHLRTRYVGVYGDHSDTPEADACPAV